MFIFQWLGTATLGCCAPARRRLAVWKLTTQQKHEVALDVAKNNWAAGFSADGRLFALACAGDNGENPRTGPKLAETL